MTPKLIEKATIGQHYICPVEYGDVTGLTDHEEAQLSQWLAHYPGATFVWGEEDEFARCEITGMMGKCVEVLIYEAA